MDPVDLAKGMHPGVWLSVMGDLTTRPKERMALAYMLGRPDTVVLVTADELAVRVKLARRLPPEAEA